MTEMGEGGTDADEWMNVSTQSWVGGGMFGGGGLQVKLFCTQSKHHGYWYTPIQKYPHVCTLPGIVFG